MLRSSYLHFYPLCDDTLLHIRVWCLCRPNVTCVLLRAGWAKSTSAVTPDLGPYDVQADVLDVCQSMAPPEDSDDVLTISSYLVVGQPWPLQGQGALILLANTLAVSQSDFCMTVALCNSLYPLSLPILLISLSDVAYPSCLCTCLCTAGIWSECPSEGPWCV